MTGGRSGLSHFVDLCGLSEWHNAAPTGQSGEAMRESETDLTQLQGLMDRSLGAAGPHLRSIFDDSNRLTAGELAAALDGIFEMHLAVVASTGAPLVAPIDGVLFRGRIWFGLPAGTVRARLLRRDPRVSASYTRRSFAFIVHGKAQEAEEASDSWKEYEGLLRDLYVAQYGPGWTEWYEHLRQQPRDLSFTGYIDPRVMFAKR
jgi:hypothetical protein